MITKSSSASREVGGTGRNNGEPGEGPEAKVNARSWEKART